MSKCTDEYIHCNICVMVYTHKIEVSIDDAQCKILTDK